MSEKPTMWLEGGGFALAPPPSRKKQGGGCGGLEMEFGHTTNGGFNQPAFVLKPQKKCWTPSSARLPDEGTQWCWPGVGSPGHGSSGFGTLPDLNPRLFFRPLMVCILYSKTVTLSTVLPEFSEPFQYIVHTEGLGTPQNFRQKCGGSGAPAQSFGDWALHLCAIVLTLCHACQGGRASGPRPDRVSSWYVFQGPRDGDSC